MGESTSSPVYTKISRGISSSTSRAFSLDRNSWLVMGGSGTVSSGTVVSEAVATVAVTVSSGAAGEGWACAD